MGLLSSITSLFKPLTTSTPTTPTYKSLQPPTTTLSSLNPTQTKYPSLTPPPPNYSSFSAPIVPNPNQYASPIGPMPQTSTQSVAPKPGESGFIGPLQPKPVLTGTGTTGTTGMTGGSTGATGGTGATSGNREVTMPNGTKVMIDNMGNIVSGMPNGGGSTGPQIPQITQDSGQGGAYSSSSSSSSSTPTAPNPETLKAIQLAEDAYKKSMLISPDELSTQGDIDNLIESTKSAFRGTSGQTIPLEFITGQLKAIEQRATGLAEPLERKLARLQAARTSSMESSKFALERADKAYANESASAKDARLESESARRFGITTGMDQSRLNEDARQADLNYKLSQQKFDEDKRQFGQEYALKLRNQALEEQKATASGATSAGGVGGATGVSELKTSALSSAQALLQKFLSGTGTSAVGTSRIFGLQNIPGTAPKDFQVQFDNLKSLLSLDNVKLLKGQGAVSDAERRLLEQASSKLDLAQSEPEFKSALESIVTALQGSTGNTPEQMRLPDGTVVTRQSDGTYK